MKGWQGAGDLRGTLQVSALEGGIRKHQENPVSGSLVLSANPSSLPTALGLRRKASYRDGIWAFVRHLRICLGSLETQNIITIEYISISPPHFFASSSLSKKGSVSTPTDPIQNSWKPCVYCL